MKKLNHILNIIIGFVIGAYIGRVLYVVWNFKTRPGLYAMNSAPWYTSIWVDGIFALAAVLICIVTKAIIKNRNKKAD